MKFIWIISLNPNIILIIIFCELFLFQKIGMTIVTSDVCFVHCFIHLVVHCFFPLHYYIFALFSTVYFTQNAEHSSQRILKTPWVTVIIGALVVRAADMAQWLKTFTAPPEKWSSDSWTHVVHFTNSCTFSSKK